MLLEEVQSGTLGAVFSLTDENLPYSLSEGGTEPSQSINDMKNKGQLPALPASPTVLV